ncbi:cupin domain-containing protein [Aquimarina algiphila]|uniref:cupin domain-containing protein n=1 Tax=Aquimarina algiphila TaxID=2047982 RepID=UPI00232A8A4F|nr:cupin domain-containing protein [Aquimarina algiphila]
MKGILITVILTIVSTLSFAQKTSKDSIIEPFKIEDRLISGLDIPRLKLKAHPEREYYQKNIYKGPELSVYILSSETALNEINNFPIDEFVYYINGRADIETKDSTKLTFYSGDYLFVPKGFSGNWTNNGGNKLHLELSVISNKRGDSTKTSIAKNPFLLDQELLSGIGLTKHNSTTYKNIIYSGVELDVFTEAEIPTKKEISENKKEQFIHILNGSLTIRPINSQPQTYYKGDFFILPKGFSGSWEVEGQRLLRILKVISK